MKSRTKIEWCDYTINCFWGCDGGCPYCAARKLARRFGRRIGTARHYPSEIIERMAEFKPVFLPDQLELVEKIKMPSKFFVSEMGDWCGKNVPVEWSRKALDVMRQNPQHIFITSTKQPQNLPGFDFPNNCWVGIGVTNRKMAEEALGIFKNVKAMVKYLMCEPLLEPMGTLDLTGVSLVIIGSQTQPYKPPEASWVEQIAQSADMAGSAVFIKNNLRSLLEPLILSYGSKRLGLPIFASVRDVKLRQELWRGIY